MVLFTEPLSRRNTFVGGTCAPPSAIRQFFFDCALSTFLSYRILFCFYAFAGYSQWSLICFHYVAFSGGSRHKLGAWAAIPGDGGHVPNN